MDAQRAHASSEVTDVDPEDFLRALLAISPEDAEKARDDAAKAMERGSVAREAEE